MLETPHILQIKNSCSLIYREHTHTKKRHSALANTYVENFKESNYKSTDINTNQIRRMKKAIDKLILISPPRKIFNPITNKIQPFRINFITLTLSAPQIHTDKEITAEILSPFLKEMQRKNLIGSYVWKAEKQKNTNIHYHITSNKFIPLHELRNIWNKHQNNLKYIDRFHEKHNHRNPNSTDIHATKNIKNLEAYLIKYITKKQEDKKLIVSSKKWDCSNNLKRKESTAVEITNQISSVIMEIINKELSEITYLDYVTIIKNNTKVKRLLLGNKEVKKEFDNFVKVINMRDKEYQKYKTKQMEKQDKRQRERIFPSTAESTSQKFRVRYIQNINGFKVPRYSKVLEFKEIKNFENYCNKMRYEYTVQALEVE